MILWHFTGQKVTQSCPTGHGDLTFGALAAVGVGAIYALGPILAGGAGALIDVELAQVPIEP